MSNDIYSKLVSIVEPQLFSVMTHAASQIADDLTDTARLAMDDFYAHYSPIYYRHRQGGIKNTFKRYYKNPHNSIWTAGVELIPGSGKYTGWHDGHRVTVETDYVSALAVFNGMHGNVEAFPHEIHNIPPRMDESPFKIIENKRDEIVSHIQRYFI